MNNAFQRTSGNVRALVNGTITSRLVVFDFQARRHEKLAGVRTGTKHEQPSDPMRQRPLAVKMQRAFPGSLYTLLVSRSRALSTHPKRGGMGGYPPSFVGLVRGGSPSMRLLFPHHKRTSLRQSTQTHSSCGLSWYGVAFYCGVLSSVREGTGPSRHPYPLLPRAGP